MQTIEPVLLTPARKISRWPVALRRVWAGTVTAIWMLGLLLFLIGIANDPASHALLPLGSLTAAGMILGWWLPRSLFKLRRFERYSGVYAALGVQLFGRFVLDGNYMNRAVRNSLPSRAPSLRRSELPTRERRTVHNERIHWAWLIGSMPIIGYAFWNGRACWTVYLLVANVLLNVYPILLQRLTRFRIESLAQRGKAADGIGQRIAP